MKYSYAVIVCNGATTLRYVHLHCRIHACTAVTIVCSDSRCSPSISRSFNPVLNFFCFSGSGTISTAGNIANQFDKDHPSSYIRLLFFITPPPQSSFFYTGVCCSHAVGTLNVKHVIVIGHYRCGGIAEVPKPNLSVCGIAIQN